MTMHPDTRRPDWTDYRRSNPEIDATRDRWNARACSAPVEATARRDWNAFAIVAAVQLVACCLPVILLMAFAGAF